ncbi:hypothetical protein [Methyloceanibacter sp.]|uniref:hypothetical protein n=1 Tax=Methyloceanibacter sp. TaxID=1965321 RepID=UPI002D1FB9D4|nr:hypothetical protein [Methyloceanibacter sp.]
MPSHDALEPVPHAPIRLRTGGFSLLRASTGQRLMLVAAMLAVLWLAVYWALQ